MILLTRLTVTFLLLPKLLKTTKYSHKHFSGYLKEECESTIFLKPTSKEEIGNIISSPKSSKVYGRNIIPQRISFLLKNEISMQLADLRKLSFVTDIFPSVLKTEKVVPVLRKIQNLIIVSSNLPFIKY